MSEFLINFSQAEIAAIRAKWQDANLKNKALTEEECDGGIDLCRRYGAHPLRNQMIPMKYFDKDSGRFTLTWITSIDMMRVGAHRTGAFAGMDDFEREYVDGRVVESKTHVYRIVQGLRCPFPGGAVWDELFSEKGLMARKMPLTWIDKCAEASGLRRAFPLECGNLYLREEVKQAAIEGGEADEEAPPTSRAVPTKGPDNALPTGQASGQASPDTDHNMTTVTAMVRDWSGCQPEEALERTKEALKASGLAKGGKTSSPEFQNACRRIADAIGLGREFRDYVSPAPVAAPAKQNDIDEEAGF